MGPRLLLPSPHICQLRLPREGCRVIIASDGVWDSVDLHRCAKVARPYAAPEAAERIVTQAVRTQGGAPKDDATCVVLDVLPAGVPSFPEALGRRLKRSVSRSAALALAEAAGGGALDGPATSGGFGGGSGGGGGGGGSFSRRRQGSASPSRSRGGGDEGFDGGGGGGGGGGGFLGCCLSPPPTGGSGRCGSPPPALADWAAAGGGGGGGGGGATATLSPAIRKVEGDRTVRGGGYGPSVRGGAAYLGAVADSRRPSSERAGAGLAAPAGPPAPASGSPPPPPARTGPSTPPAPPPPARRAGPRTARTGRPPAPACASWRPWTSASCSDTSPPRPATCRAAEGVGRRRGSRALRP